MEDEPLVRNFHARLLERHGYRVVTACDGVEAVDLFSSQPEAFDALLLDIGLPIMDGIEAFRRMRQKRAGIPALFCSALLQFQSLPASNSQTDFVAKPVDGKVLVDKLNQLLLGHPKAS